MSTFLQPQFLILCYVLLRSGDIAIASSMSRDVIRAILYGIVAICALVVIATTLMHG